MRPLHDWNLTPAAAAVLQRRLAGRLVLSGAPRPRLVAGVDGSYTRFSPVMWAGIVVWDVETGEVVERVARSGRTPFPYVPGFLTFREGPLVLQVFGELRHPSPPVVPFRDHRSGPRKRRPPELAPSLEGLVRHASFPILSLPFPPV
ncbi:MAG: hypothetical protein GX442_06170, partial [Candidatus Riflebacteria bacterium]|nr:hypothetical protein [Candidatus Riflebacteria bacterium]